jgi:hypothetical protein
MATKSVTRGVTDRALFLAGFGVFAALSVAGYFFWIDTWTSGPSMHELAWLSPFNRFNVPSPRWTVIAFFPGWLVGSLIFEWLPYSFESGVYLALASGAAANGAIGGAVIVAVARVIRRLRAR